jgi:transcriptional regulator with XRE-family HTH domain
VNKGNNNYRSNIVADRLAKSDNLKKLFAHDVAMLSITSALIEEMQNQSVSRLDLAKRIGKSKGFVSQVLSGSRNMTVRTIADIALALGKEISGVQLRDVGTSNVSVEAMNNHLDHWHSLSIEIVSSSERGYQDFEISTGAEVALA